MTRHSHVNGFVVFPSKWMESEWEHHSKVTQLNHEALAEEFRKLLDDSTDEAIIHNFFEVHPQVLPDVARYHNGPRGDLVISKLPLGADFVCDFAFVSENSQRLQFTCIEIESPRKRIFKGDGSFSRHYLDAKQQIADWNGWAQQNIRETARLFARLGRWLPDDCSDISLECILIIGRRAELNTPKRKQRWAAEHALSQASMQIMTYDRLIEGIASSFHSWNKRMLVCHYRDRALHVKNISE